MGKTDNFIDSLIFHIPHSSIDIPLYDGYNVNLIQSEIDKLTDFNTDIIFDIPNTTKLIFPYSRIFCDVERYDDDKEEMYKFGRGYFYTKTDNGEDLRSDINDIKQIVYDNYYKPHHNKLIELIKDKLENVGLCIIVDCHSFSNVPFNTDINKKRCDINIGTTQYNTPAYITNLIIDYFSEYNVMINEPYLGSILPDEFIGNKNVISVMIEINRNLISNEKDINKMKILINNLFKNEFRTI